MIKPSLCCIYLADTKKSGYEFQTMTFARFSVLPRNDALEILGGRILHNLRATNKIIQKCDELGWDYRCSSSLFPLITMDEANVKLEDLPNYNDINSEFDNIKTTITNSNVRISSHPGPFTVLASTNETAVKNSIQELNFYSWFFDRIGLPTNHNSPINFHINNKQGSYDEIIGRFLKSFDQLHDNCRARITIEIDDKLNCWNVNELVNIFHPATQIPITYDSHHHRLNSDGVDPETAMMMCYETWGNIKPVMHFSNGKASPSDKAHSDYVYEIHDELFTLPATIDYEYKAKNLAISDYLTKYVSLV